VTNDVNGEVIVVLTTGQILKVSRRYKARIADQIQPFMYN
jgi:hypothetical protein